MQELFECTLQGLMRYRYKGLSASLHETFVKFYQYVPFYIFEDSCLDSRKFIKKPFFEYKNRSLLNA